MMRYNVSQLLKDHIGATRHYPLQQDISDLDPSSEGAGEGGWGGLSEFSGRANEAVARAVANSGREGGS